MKKVFFLIALVVGLLRASSSFAVIAADPPTDLDAWPLTSNTFQLQWQVHPASGSPITRHHLCLWPETGDTCVDPGYCPLSSTIVNSQLIPPTSPPVGYVKYNLYGINPSLQYCWKIRSFSVIVYSDFSAIDGPIFLTTKPVANAGDNIQITSAAQIFTVVQGTATDPDTYPLYYRWLEGTTVLQDWLPAANGEANLDLASLTPMSIGLHTLTLQVSDGIYTVVDDMVLTIANSPPEVQPAPSSQTVEIGIDPIIVVADVSDFDGDSVTYEWLLNGEVLASASVGTLPGGETVQVPSLVIQAGDPSFPLGPHMIEIRVSDSVNSWVSAFVSVEVIDTTAPSLSPLPSITMLWPPNHTLQPVTIQANAFDNGGGSIHLDVSVPSSELLDMNGDGSTIPDYYIDSVSDETGLIELRLRSERSGTGAGRTYTINITATDGSGNQSQAAVEVRAPHDRRKY